MARKLLPKVISPKVINTFMPGSINPREQPHALHRTFSGARYEINANYIDYANSRTQCKDYAKTGKILDQIFITKSD